MLRFNALITPVVTVCEKPKGLPMAITVSPITEIVAVAHRDGWQLFPRVDFEHGEVRVRVGANDSGFVLALVLEHGFDGSRPLDDVGVCQD